MLNKSTVKYIQSLQHKKFRDEHNTFVAEGPKVVEDMLRADEFQVEAIYALDDWIDGLEEKIKNIASTKFIAVKDFELEKIAAQSTPNKVVAIFEKKIPRPIGDLKNKFTLGLDDIQDPGNLGTIIRTADWFGIENIICSPGTADIYNPKVIQSSMASIAHINILYEDLHLFLSRFRGIDVFAATLEGKPLKSFMNYKQGIIFIGNEGRGINNELLKKIPQHITIPGVGKAESLNAAVAAGIILSAFLTNVEH